MAFRRKRIPVVQGRALPSPAGTRDSIVYRCLTSINEAITALRSELNPGREEGVPDLWKGLTRDEIQEMIDEAMAILRGEIPSRYVAPPVEAAADDDILEPFQIYDEEATAFKMYENMAEDFTIFVAGDIQNDTISVNGIGAISGGWSKTGVSASLYVWLQVDIKNDTRTLFVATTKPATTEPEFAYTEVVPLYYIPWDTDHIDWDNKIQFGGGIRTWPGSGA